MARGGRLDFGTGSQSSETYEELHAVRLAGHGWYPIALGASLFFVALAVGTFLFVVWLDRRAR